MAFCGQCGTKSSGGAFCTECGSEIASTPEKGKQKSSPKSTPLSVRAEILSALWIQYKNNPDFQEFVEYNDLGLPLAYAVDHGIIEMNKEVSMFVNETFDALLTEVAIEEDTGFEDVQSVLGWEPED
jgi:hypothetical protein